ncbi:MAG: ParA family protein, partial [Chloroflexi bacterium]|nr:ParA family protein [Chloroflexota bacterium]
MPARIVSFINLKGGVGKTTLALAIGEFLAFANHYPLNPKSRVLLIDIDAQSNLSYALFPEQRLEEIWNAEQSVYHMFKSALDGKNWDIRLAIPLTNNLGVTNIEGNTHLNALVCSPDLGQLDEEILSRLEKGANIPVDFRTVLKDQLENVKEFYDWIIIDCPPSLSTLTSNAILCSDYYVVPLVPEALSIKGLDLIQSRIADLKNHYGNQIKIEYAGAILNRIDIRRKDHIKQAEDVYSRKGEFSCFDYWVGDWKPLYVVSDYGYPFENGQRAWGSVWDKYGLWTRRKNPNSSILPRTGDT